MIYQHATRDRDKAIADALGQLAGKARTKPSGAIPGSDLFRDSPNCALPGGTSRIGGPPQYRHPGHNLHDGRTAQLRDGHLHEHGPGNRPH